MMHLHSANVLHGDLKVGVVFPDFTAFFATMHGWPWQGERYIHTGYLLQHD